MIRPKPLKKGDKIVIVSPSSKVEPKYVNDTTSIFIRWGLKVSTAENALKSAGMFSGFIDQRVADLQKALDAPDIKLIFCSRGGYGAVHLLDRLNYEGIKKYPKWLLGFSDITAIHNALQSKGIMSLHAPMCRHFSCESNTDVSVLYTKSLLAGQPIRYKIPSRFPHLDRDGFATGRLFGGNLSVFCGLLGTKYARVPRNGILFIEDVGEKPYKVDRMIYQLKLAGVFDKIKALIVGEFTDFEEDNQMYSTLYDSIRQIVRPYDFPICFGFPAGHGKLNFPLVLGAKTRININKSVISFKQL